MSDRKPGHYMAMKSKFPQFITAAEQLGKAASESGPLEEKQVLLIQLGAAAAIGSEGSVHSHMRRALAAGATREECEHAVIALTSIIVFPKVAATLAWLQDD